MKKKYIFDYLIVGCGLFGSTFARFVADRGQKSLVIDKRNHIGGNCYTERVEGINVHKYGPHIFHTNSEKVWKFVNRFAQFNNFSLRPKTCFQGKMFSFPVNLMTMHQLWGVNTPEEAKAKIESVRIPTNDPSNLENWILSQVGEEIYEKFIKGYTIKQWRKDPKELPASIIQRLPIRFTYNDRYFEDKYEGIPIGGYTQMIENILDHDNIQVETNIDFFANRQNLVTLADKVIYTGKIDEFFDYRLGELEYRSLSFDTKVLDGDFQGNALIIHPEEKTPYTRVVEHKHFDFKETAKTVVTWEYPENYTSDKIPYYPINNASNNAKYELYRQMATQEPKILFGGRLGRYHYFNMDQIIASSLTLAEANVPL